MQTIDLKKDKRFLSQYVALRNSYCDQLLTFPVGIGQTEDWLDKNGQEVEILGLLEADNLLGVSILYLNKNGEVAFFVKDKNKGTGSKLLKIIEEAAKLRKLSSIYAWVAQENTIAQHVFEKSGFVKEKDSDKEYKGKTRGGILYKKYLINHDYR